MRWLIAGEQKKRGCKMCTEVAKKYNPANHRNNRVCPHAECPYTVLDKYDTYEDYLKSEDSKINIAALVEAGESAGRLTPSARVNIPVLRRLGGESLF